ncbi:MAG: discoidin domain-containing protein [Planctomycetia bacterium]|nr:discoidin domain-containing protein [Planctomycetia bacterium]
MNERNRDRILQGLNRKPRAIVKLLAGTVVVGSGMLQATGCNKPAATEAPVVAPPVVAKPVVIAAGISPKEAWEKLVRQAQTEIEADRVDEAQRQMDALATVYVAPKLPDEAQQKELAALTKQLQDKRKALLAQDRAAKLTEAKNLLKEGKYTEASAAVSFVLNRAPTLEQESLAKSLNSAIDEARRARNLMQNSMRFLASDNPREVDAARIELPRQADVSMPLLVEASADAAKPKLVGRALSLMVQLDRPALAIPAMVAVLKRPEQKESWPDAIQALERLNRPGAGEPLLALALEATTPEGQIAALTALSKVTDTPPRTVVALLPLLEANGPALAAALMACGQAVQALDQTDLTAYRNLDVALSAEDEKRLAALPQRLLKLAAGGEEGLSPEAAQQAKTLAIATHLLSAEPLKGVKVLRAGSELPESPAAAVVDGVWNTIEPASMWCYPVTGRGTIMLDLGAERTVTGVRIWNLNNASAATLGWKEVRVIVSIDPSEVRSPKLGLVAPAPGVATTADYSVTIPVNFQRGRYVEVSANSLWTTPTGEGNSGLAEIQILGF